MERFGSSMQLQLLAKTLLIILLSFLSTPCWAERQVMGINYGILGDNLPSPQKTVALMRQMHVGKVKIYDANPNILAALANSGMETTISVTTDLIAGIANDKLTADKWIADNVVAYPNSQIQSIIVGNELFSYPDLTKTWYQILPAMQNLQASLVSRKMAKSVKITTAVAMSVLGTSYPPSSGAFRSDIESTFMQPILQFILSTQSSLFLNVYPYFAWASDTKDISIEYALFGMGKAKVIVQDGNLNYTSLLDAQVDAVIAAMARVGCGDARITISETGWPTGGDPSEPGTNVKYAAIYNRLLVKRTMSNPPAGTPKRPGQFFPTYVFALFDEDQKPGPGTERNWGLLYANGSAIYGIDLTGRSSYDDTY